MLCDFRLLESPSTCAFNLVLTVLPDKVTPNHPMSTRFWEHTIEAEGPKLLIQTCLFPTREACNANGVAVTWICGNHTRTVLSLSKFFPQFVLKRK